MTRPNLAIPQAAVVAFHAGRICLVTSRSRKGWIVPKGRIEPGQTAADTALQEAWEEAGLAGFLHEDPLGHYEYEKNGNLYHVTVFVMEVTQVHDEWPEIDERQRAWASAENVHLRVYQPALRQLLRRKRLQVCR